MSQLLKEIIAASFIASNEVDKNYEDNANVTDALFFIGRQIKHHGDSNLEIALALNAIATAITNKE